jgi:hypothetical protein
MIKLSILMVRRSDLTYERFIQHWGEVHGLLFAAQSESKQYWVELVNTSRPKPRLHMPPGCGGPLPVRGIRASRTGWLHHQTCSHAAQAASSATH